MIMPVSPITYTHTHIQATDTHTNTSPIHTHTYINTLAIILIYEKKNGRDISFIIKALMGRSHHLCHTYLKHLLYVQTWVENK